MNVNTTISAGGAVVPLAQASQNAGAESSGRVRSAQPEKVIETRPAHERLKP